MTWPIRTRSIRLPAAPPRISPPEIQVTLLSGAEAMKAPSATRGHGSQQDDQDPASRPARRRPRRCVSGSGPAARAPGRVLRVDVVDDQGLGPLVKDDDQQRQQPGPDQMPVTPQLSPAPGRRRPAARRAGGSRRPPDSDRVPFHRHPPAAKAPEQVQVRVGGFTDEAGHRLDCAVLRKPRESRTSGPAGR